VRVGKCKIRSDHTALLLLPLDVTPNAAARRRHSPVQLPSPKLIKAAVGRGMTG
jgi:hypothetical protein